MKSSKFLKHFCSENIDEMKRKEKKKRSRNSNIYTNALYEQIQSDYDQNSRRWWTSDQIDCIEIGTGKLL